MSELDDDRRAGVCSRAGCRAAPAWRVNWRNPRIHGTDRVKVWVACDEHRDFLRDYLDSRDFPVVVTGIGVELAVVPDRPSVPDQPGRAP